MNLDKESCPVVKVDGFIEKGKQFDLEIRLPEDNRNVIYGVIKDCYREPVGDAVVKLVEIEFEHGKEERKPVSHTFTDENGEFVFGPLCPDKTYEVLFWVNQVKHVKICAEVKRDKKCLKGTKLECPEHECECEHERKPCREPHKEPCREPHKEERPCEDKCCR